MKSLLRLFNAVEIEDKELKKELLLKQTIENGYILSPEITGNKTKNEIDNIIKEINEVIGIADNQLNSSFHKSWKKVKNASLDKLVLEQIIHYITTYGFEELGIYNQNNVFIPNEKLNIPNININKIKLTIIKGYTEKEIKEKVLLLLESGIALKEETIKDIIDVCLYIGINEKDISKVKNKEAKIFLYDYLNIMPKNNVEFLRFIIYKLTASTLIIKNKELIDKIKLSNTISIIKYFELYEKEYGLNNLSEIFHRFKPIFLAFRNNSKMKILINRIRRLSKKFHKPMKEDYFNNVTKNIKENKINKDEFIEKLKDINIFRKIRLAYSLNYRVKKNNNAIVYRVRNGKGFASELDNKNRKEIKEYLNILMESITNDIKKNVENKKIFIPKYIKYALPATEKQFIGNIPFGSFIKLKKEIIIGVHWENQGYNRIDLDLSLINKTKKIGWDGQYRNEGKTLLFSGDMTDAPLPNGASELFYVNIDNEEDYCLNLNYFNYDEKIKVPFTLFLGSEKVEHMRKNYVFNPNNIISKIEMVMDVKQKVLGYLKTGEKNKFYFNETIMGKAITTKNTEYMKLANDYYNSYFKNSIILNKILKQAGAIIVDNNKECDIDLSIENLEKDSILKLLI